VAGEPEAEEAPAPADSGPEAEQEAKERGLVRALVPVPVVTHQVQVPPAG